MKNILLFRKPSALLFWSFALLVILNTHVSWGQTTIVQQDFEASPASPTLTYTNTLGGFSSGANTGGRPATNLFASGLRGWVANNQISTLTFANQSLSGYTNCFLNFRLGGFSTNLTNGIDAADLVTVSISVDGGTTYSSELTIGGSAANQYWDFGASGSTTITYDGNNSPTAVTSSIATGISTVTINIPNANSQVRVRISMQTNDATERLVIDDVRIRGTEVAACTTQTITAISPSSISKNLGDPAYSVATTATSGLPVSYSLVSVPSSGVASVDSSGNVTILGAGTATITASQAGGVNNSITYCAANSVTQSLTVTAATPTITLANETKTYGDGTFTMTATTNSPGTISYDSFHTDVATINSTTGLVTIKGAGTATILVSQAAGGIYAAGSTTATITVNPATTGITITANGVSKTYGATLNNGSSTDFTVSGLLYTDNLGTGATVTNTYGLGGGASDSATLATVSPAVYVGSVVPSAVVVGTGSNLYNPANYAAPTYVGGNITVSKANQTITFGALAAKTYGDAPFTLSASASSGLAVGYSSASGVASISGNTLTILEAGSATITASQAGDDNYNAATIVDQILTVTPKGLTITGLTVNNKNFDGTTAATLSGTGSLNGIVGSDDVALSGTPVGTFASSAVGTGIAVNVTGYTLAGANASNYSIPQPTNLVLSADIIANSPTIFTSGTLATVNTTYGSASATPTSFNVSAQSLTDAITILAPSGFEVSTSSTTGYASSITVGGVGSLSSTPIYVRLAATNTVGIYSGFIILQSTGAIDVAIATADSTVAPKELTITGLTGVDKTYDTTTTATITGTATLNGVVGTDDVTLNSTSVTYAFADVTAGPAKPITVLGFSLNGTTAGNYTVAQPTDITATIFKSTSTITVIGDASYTFNTFAQGPNASNVSGSTGEVTYSYTGVVPAVTASPTPPTNAGTYTVAATVASDTNYEAATSADFSFTIDKADQTISLAATDTKTTASAPYTLTLNSSVGLPITYTSPDTSVITISGNTVTIVGAGTATITANQAGNSNYNAATPASQVLTVTAVAAPILTWNTFGNTGNETTEPSTSNNANIASATLNYTGSTVTPAGNGNRFGGSNWAVGALSTTKYIQFTVTPNAGFTFSPSSFTFIWDFSSSGPKSVTLRSSVDNYVSDLGSITTMTTSTSTVRTISISGLTNISTATTFRLYGYDATATTGTGGFDCASTTNNVVLNGFVTPLPAPVITSALTASGTVGTSFNYATTATNSPISFSATGLPSGLSIDTTSGVISGTPLVAGTFNVSLTASNSSNSTSETLVLTVEKGSQTITFGTLEAKTFGAASFALTGSASSGLTVTYVSSNESVATISGNQVIIVGAGSTTITATQPGDDNYFPAAIENQLLEVNKANQTITFGALPAKNDVDGSFTLFATASSGLPVSYSSSNTGVVNISGSTATIGAPGTTIITASQEGNDNYNPATSVDQEQIIINTQLANQTITFGALNPVTYGDAPFTLNATVNSPLTITYASSDETIASVSGNTVTIHKSGTVTITASQDGDSTHNPAADVSQSLVVNKKGLNAVNVSLANKTYDGTTAATLTADLDGVIGTDDVTLTNAAVFATANAGNGIAVTANLSLSGDQADRYEITQPTGLTANIFMADQTITFEAITDKTYGDTTFTLTATGGASGNPIVFTSSDPQVSISGNTVTIVGVGSVTITATQAGNSNYNAAVDVTQSFIVNKANQTITFNALVNRTTVDNSFTLNATTTSTLAVSYSSSNESVATIFGNTVTIVGAGTTTITASQAGNDLYNPASVAQNQLVLTAIAKWTFEGVTTTNTGSAPVVSVGSAVADLGDQTTGTLFSANHASASTVWSNPAGNGSVKSVSCNNWGVGDYYQFQVNTSNYQSIAIAFDQTGSSTGPSTFKLQYSLDGITYTDFSSSYTLDSEGWNSGTYRSQANRYFDLSSITGLNNDSAVYFRIVDVNTTSIGNGTVGTAGTSRIDNFVVTGIGCNNTSSTETVTACDSYTWNGTTYNASGLYTGTTTNCVTEQLDLTITPSSDNITTITACDNYTWNGTVYNTSGIYTGTTTNCVTEKLDLTITPSSINTTTISACDSYTWNGITYNTSGLYTGTTTNCVTEQLALTITPSSDNITTITACDSYTWNGITYNVSGLYTGTTTNCVTEKLDLTIDSLSITTQPTSPTICKAVGASTSISVAAAGATPTYQWFTQTPTGTSWTALANNANYAGVNSSTLTITRTTTSVPATGTKYRLAVSNSCLPGGLYSDEATLLEQTVLSKAATITAKSATNGTLSPALTTCQDSSVNLTLAAGSVGNIQWQSSTDGINFTNFGPLFPQSALSVANPAIPFSSGNLTQDTWFRVVASNGVCNSVNGVAIKITVSSPAVAGTITGGDVTVCGFLPVGTTALDANGNSLSLTGITNSTVLTLNGNTGIVTWQRSTNVLTSATPTWSTVTTGVVGNQLTATNLTADTWYRVLVKNGACTATSAVTKITVSKAAKAGSTTVTTNGVVTTSVCTGGDITFTSAVYTGTAIQWEVSTTSTTAGFAPVVGATGISYTMTNVAYTPLSKFYVRSVVTSGTCTLARSAVKTITVNPLSVAGTIKGGGTLCVNGGSTVSLSGNTGTIQWEYSTDGTSYFVAPYWKTVSGVPTYFNPNGTTEFSTAASNGTATTYVFTNFNAAGTVYFRARIKSGACSETYTSSVQYVNGLVAVAGTISPLSATICPSTGTTLTLTGSVGAIQWQKATISATTGLPGTFANISGQTGTTLATGNLTASTAYQAVVTIGSCSTVTAAYVSVFVVAKPITKTITSVATTPTGSISAPLCTNNPQKVLTIGAGSTGTIQWQTSTTSTTTGFTDIDGENGVSYTVTNPAVGVNYYRASFTNSCGVVAYNSAVTLYYTTCGAREVAIVEAPILKAPFAVVVYPNPYSESFNLSLTTSSEEKVGVMVYDMTGKLIEQREVKLSEVSELHVGDRYPSGVYNVIVTQGEEVKTLRVVKR